MPPGIQRDVVARFRVPDGQHLYDDPVPEGLVAATIEIESAHGLIVFDEIRPSTHPLELGDGTSLSVYDGDVVIRRPVTQNGQAGERIDGTRMVMIRGTVRWQACDDDQCGLPQRQAFELTVPAGRIVIPDTGPAAGKAVPMNGDKHLERMRTRRGV
ncbi:MAG: protein-disulfide reductase DsbD domain-containing protein [Actinomycetota bacterium]